MTTPDIQQARKWAKEVSEEYLTYITDDSRAAVKVIQSLPDQWVDAKKLRELADQLGEEAGDFVSEGLAHRYLTIAKRLRDIPLTPSLPTLADMTPEEREACQWMQVDLSSHLPGAILTDPVGHGSESRVMYQGGATFTVKHEEVTPLPDLPKLEWPSLSVSGESEAVSVETEESEGLPRPEDVPAGEPWIVKYDGHKWVGTRDSTNKANWPWVLARLDGVNCCVARDSEISLISRLVPEVSRG